VRSVDNSTLNFEALLSLEDVARLCRLSVKAVYRAIQRQELPAAKLCNRLRIQPGDLDAWIEQSRIPACRPASVLLPDPAPPARATLRALREIEQGCVA
jgi:excisionase family DNA binding protein